LDSDGLTGSLLPGQPSRRNSLSFDIDFFNADIHANGGSGRRDSFGTEFNSLEFGSHNGLLDSHLGGAAGGEIDLSAYDAVALGASSGGAIQVENIKCK